MHRFHLRPRAARILLALLTSLALAPAFAQAVSPSAQPGTTNAAHDAALDTLIRKQMDEGALVGVAAAIVVDGQIAWRGGYGEADRQTRTPFTTATTMNIASISKTVIGAALMRAAEQGKLALDDDVDRHLPFKVDNPRRPGVPITLRQLATHTSGITDRWEVYGRSYHFGGDAPVALGDFLAGYLVPGGRDYAKDNFLDVAPGTHRDYSNIGAALAAYAIQRATGQPFEDYTREQFFAPLGMTHTRWHLAGAPAGSDATPYLVDEGWPLPLPPYTVPTWPDGGLRTSVDDLSKFFVALLRGGERDGVRILAPASAAEMPRLQWSAARKPDNVEIAEKNSGIFWQTKFDTRYVGHGGSDPGMKTEMLATPDGTIGVVLFTNTAGPGTDKAYVAILQALFAHAETLRAKTSR